MSKNSGSRRMGQGVDVASRWVMGSYNYAYRIFQDGQGMAQAKLKLKCQMTTYLDGLVHQIGPQLVWEPVRS